MVKHFFGNWQTTASTGLAAVLLIYIIYHFVQRKQISEWRGRTVLLFVMGLALCLLVAFRDRYVAAIAGGEGLFALDSFPIVFNSILGGVIILTFIVSFFLKKQEL